MPRYIVTKTLIVQADVQLVIEASDADEAADLACHCVPSNIATDYRDAGWKATVDVKPPSDIAVMSKRCRTTWIDSTDSNKKPRRITAAHETAE